MKKFIVSLTSLLLSIFPFFASNGNNNSNDPKTTFLTVDKRPNRPHSPGRNDIPCFYGEWFIQIEMPADANFMKVSLEKDGAIEWSGIITHEEPHVQLPELSGTYTVHCETDTHQFFSGSIWF